MRTFSRLFLRSAPITAEAIPAGRFGITADASGNLQVTNSSGETKKVSIMSEGTPVFATFAQGTLTSTGVAPADGATVTIGGKVYTFQTTLTNVNGNVHVGSSAAQALDHLKAAVNLDAGAGTQYAAATTEHPTVEATTNTNTTQLFVAKTAGTVGNVITTTESSGVLSFGAATLTGGTNATLADAGDTLFDEDFVYVAVANVTASSTTGWNKIAHAPI